MKKRFKVVRNPIVATEVQEAVNYYFRETGNHKLGKRFFATVNKQIKALKTDALLYAVKYDEIRCVNISKFPYRAHYTLNEESKTVMVEAVINTSKDPDNWVK